MEEPPPSFSPRSPYAKPANHRRRISQALVDAVKKGLHREVKRLLLHDGADPRQRLGKAECVTDVYEMRAMQKPALGEASTVLHLACIMQHVKVAQVLTLCGADIWALDKMGKDAVSLLESEDARAELCRLSELVLETHDGADSDSDDEGGQSAYWRAT